MKKYSITVLLILSTKVLLAQTALTVQDTRATPTTPASYNRSVESHFKATTVLGLTSGYYQTVLGIRGWYDDTGGAAHELAFGDDSKIYLRSGFERTGWGAWRSLLISNEDGNFGIGTITPREKLSVNGNIRAREIKVEATNWPDYVFEKGYKVITLEELENYIKANKHLPGMPTAKEIETNGLELGEMVKLQQQKIEELTLHLIEKDKQLQNGASLIKNQQMQIDELKKGYLEIKQYLSTKRKN